MAHGSCPGEGQWCFFTLLPILALPLLGPLLLSGLGSPHRSPICTKRRLLSVPPLRWPLAWGPARVVQGAPGTCPLHGSLTGSGCLLPPHASGCWDLLAASIPLERDAGKMARSELPCLPRHPRGPRETHTLAAPTVAAPSALSLCPDVSLPSYFSSAQIGWGGGGGTNEQACCISR